MEFYELTFWEKISNSIYIITSTPIILDSIAIPIPEGIADFNY